MRYIEMLSYGDPDVLHVGETHRPEIEPGKVLIKVAAAGVNRLDCFQRTGHYPPPPGASSVLGLEVAGDVVAVGEGVDRWRLGDRVCALLSGGGYAEYALADAGVCLPIPAGIDVEAGAALPEAAFTVWSMVWRRGGLNPGESMLIQGGSSGIGTFAIQLAKARGHRVIATAGSATKCALARRLGADVVVNYQEQDFAAEALAATQGEGVDVILDMVGGPYLARHLDILREDGRLLIIAFLGGAKGELNFARLLKKRLTVTAATLRARDVAFKAALARELEKEVWPLIDAGRIRPVIHKVMPLREAAEAHRMLEAGEVGGKILLRP